MTSPRAVVFVGRRMAALRAARRLGIDVIRIDASAPRARDGVLAHLAWPADARDPAAWRTLAAGLPARASIASVIALTEGAVLPAAWLRAELALDGIDVATAVRCTDKLAMKTAIQSAGLACARFLACEPHVSGGALIDALGLPLVLKPRTASGGRGQWVVRHERELPDPLPAGHLAESFVEGTELSCEAFVAGAEVLFTNATEYLRVGDARIVPAPIVPAPLVAATAQALDAFHRRALGALEIERALTHTEIFLTERGPVFGETAVRPPGGHIMRLLELVYGFDPWRVWLEIHLGRRPTLDATPCRAAGAWILHEGAGRVRSISGLDAVRALPGVKTARLRVKAASSVGPRLGSGDEIGHLIVVGRDRDEVAERLVAARAALRIEMER
jgi:biotin carboxylase